MYNTMWVGKGDIILSSLPYASILYPEYRGVLCRSEPFLTIIILFSLQLLQLPITAGVMPIQWSLTSNVNSVDRNLTAGVEKLCHENNYTYKCCVFDVFLRLMGSTWWTCASLVNLRNLD